MLKITVTGNLTNDVKLRDRGDGRPYAILRVASDRRYRISDGTRPTDFVSVKVRDALAERCAAYAYKGCKLAVSGDFETIPASHDRPSGFLIKATDVEFLSPKRVETASAASQEAAQANREAAESELPESTAIA